MIGNIRLLVLPSIENIEEIVRKLPIPISLTKGYFTSLKFIFKNNRVSLIHKDFNLKDFSNIWLSSYWETRDLAYAVKLYLDFHNIPHTFVEKGTSKITDQITFSLNDIRSPNTFFVNSSKFRDFIEDIESVCSYPLIIKDIKGSRGAYSAFVNNRTELLEQFALLPSHRKFFFQEYIPNEYDWGIIVANGNVVSAERSYPVSGEFRNNASMGAREEFVKIEDVPVMVKNMAIKASKKLGLTWSRSDILIDKNTGLPYLLEVNRSPGITSGTSEVRSAKEFLESHLDIVQEQLKSLLFFNK